jgi:protein required for attachment to host cells
MRNKTHLILVADAGRAIFFKSENRGASIETVPGNLDAMPNPPSREHKSDKPGRASDASSHRSAMEPKHDPHKLAEESFARTVAQHLEKVGKGSDYDGILIFAPPTFLGSLRREMNSHVAGLIEGEVHKDLTKSPVDEIQRHVREALFPE